MKVFCQYSLNKTLLPVKGDYITEIGLMTAMSQFAKVYYSGSRFRVEREDYGLTTYPGEIAARVTERDYDLYYVRANSDVFMRIPKDRPCIWMSAPFDAECYRRASAIVTLTETWRRKLRAGAFFRWIPEVYQRKYKNVITFHQVVLDYFKPQQGSNKVKHLREKIGGDFVIGFFGRRAKSTFPFAFLHLLPRLVKKYPGVRFLVAVPEKTRAKDSEFPSSPYIVRRFFAHVEMPYALSACDLVLMPSRGEQFEYIGSMEAIEAAACGVPILLGQSPARAELLGSDYPFFQSPLQGNLNGETGIEEDATRTWAMLEMIIENKALRLSVARSLSQKADFYSVRQSALRMEETLQGVLKE